VLQVIQGIRDMYQSIAGGMRYCLRRSSTRAGAATRASGQKTHKTERRRNEAARYERLSVLDGDAGTGAWAYEPG